MHKSSLAYFLNFLNYGSHYTLFPRAIMSSSWSNHIINNKGEEIDMMYRLTVRTSVVWEIHSQCFVNGYCWLNWLKEGSGYTSEVLFILWNSYFFVFTSNCLTVPSNLDLYLFHDITQYYQVSFISKLLILWRIFPPR